MGVIWGEIKAKCFYAGDWTGQNRLKGLRKLAFARKRNLGFLTTAYRLIGTKP
jgi:hypothetical protein